MYFANIGKVFIGFLLMLFSMNLNAQFKASADCLEAINKFHESYNPEHLALIMKYDEVQNIDKLESSPYYKIIVYALFEDLLVLKINEEKTSDIGEILKELYSEFNYSHSPKFIKNKEDAYNDYYALLKL